MPNKISILSIKCTFKFAYPYITYTFKPISSLINPFPCFLFLGYGNRETDNRQ